MDNLVAPLVLAHETEIRDIRAGFDLDFLVVDETVKKNLLKAVTEGDPRGKRIRAFRVVIAALQTDE
jgi:hypothetical protein